MVCMMKATLRLAPTSTPITPPPLGGVGQTLLVLRFDVHNVDAGVDVDVGDGRSLPVDSELAACYAWEAREYSKKEKASLKLREQRARLKLLGAGRQWEGSLRVRDRVGDPWEFRFVWLLLTFLPG